MTEKKGKGTKSRAGDDLAQLRGQLGRSTPVAQEVREERPSRESRESAGERGANGAEEKPRRITVDLDAARHRVLREFAFNERVKGTEILRALLDELDGDPELAERVRDRLAGE